MRLYVKDTYTNKVREVGLNRHDALWVVNGALHYRNFQNGEGTLGGGYVWCDKNGNTDFDNEEYDSYYPFDMTTAEYDLICEVEYLQKHLLLRVLGFEHEFEGLDLESLQKLNKLLDKEFTKRKKEYESRLSLNEA